MSMVGSLRKVARLARRGRRRVDLSHPARSPLGSTVVNCVIYRDGVRQPTAPTVEESLARVRKHDRGFVWLGLHPLAVENAVQAHQRPKVERYGDVLFAVFKTVCYVEHEELTATSEVVTTGEIMVFAGPDFVVTVRHGRHGSLGPLREDLEADPEQLRRGPAAVLHGIADHVVDDYLNVTDSFQDDLDQVESDVFSPQSPRTADAGRIYQLKRELLELKRAVVPVGRPLQQLASEPMPSVEPAIQAYFRDVSDHLIRATEQIHAFDALLDSILQAHLAQVTVGQNEDMRKITAWAAIVAVPTMVCGIYGMNFEHMPELHWRYGYPLVLSVIGIVCFFVHRGFKRNGWL